jgi:hypothetical protein
MDSPSILHGVYGKILPAVQEPRPIFLRHVKWKPRAAQP